MKRPFLLEVGVGQSAVDQEHAKSIVIAVAEAAGDAAVEPDQSVDRFGTAVAGAAGVEVGQEGLAPLLRVLPSRSKHGVSTSTTSRRPWLCATTPHCRQPIGPGGDSTRTLSPPTSRSSSTPVTCNPDRPTSRSHREL